MTIEIYKTLTVEAFQAAFSKEFPYLRVSFFRNADTSDVWSGFMVLKTKTLLSELSNDINFDVENFTFSRNMTVAEFEKTLKTRYNLSVKIFRNYYGDWIETTETRHLDLEGQNELGSSKKQNNLNEMDISL